MGLANSWPRLGFERFTLFEPPVKAGDMNEQNGKFTTNEQAQATVRAVAVVLLAIGLAAAYWVWPSGITDLTLASITFGALLRAIASGAIAIVSCVITAMLWN